MENVVIITLIIISIFLLGRLLGEMNKTVDYKKYCKNLEENKSLMQLELDVANSTLKKYQDGICNITIYRANNYLASRVFVAIKKNDLLGTEEKVSPFNSISIEDQMNIAKEDSIELINNVDRNLGK